jgi:hypothetical protein
VRGIIIIFRGWGMEGVSVTFILFRRWEGVRGLAIEKNLFFS